jgi:hypothetical protein
VFDCGMFAAGAIEAMTGVDLAAEFRGQYAGSISAEKAMRRYCGGGLEELAAKVAREGGLEEIDPRLAQRGDPVIVRDAEAGEAFGSSTFVDLWRDGLGPWPRLSRADCDRPRVEGVRCHSLHRWSAGCC